jgi:hypothetical protein
MTVDETMDAMKKAGQVTYAAPSGMPTAARSG